MVARIAVAAVLFVFAVSACAYEPSESGPRVSDTPTFEWRHLSTINTDLPVPNPGNQQTATAVFDVDNDGINNFLIAERTQAPAVVWYRYTGRGWSRYVVEGEALRIEAGSAVYDIDRDGDLDVVFGGDAGSNQVWWWENPYPDFDPEVPWKRHTIKDSGATKHHDQLFVDFDGSGDADLIFWNQNARRLYLARVPGNPRESGPWELEVVYEYSDESEPPQRGTYPQWKSVNEHEGLARADIDGDGVENILGGGRWFRYEADGTFSAHLIDEGYAFSRAAAGQLIPGGRPEVVLVVGDGSGPLMMYEWRDGGWNATILIEEVHDGHSLELIDFDGDGNLDIFCAEMRLSHPEPKTRILLGDGRGGFREILVTTGFGLHESRIVDLTGDGRLDVLGKPYTWEAPRLDIWINETE
jgi:hypothetical protein